MDKILRIHELVAKLNQYRHEYYNLAAPTVSDARYDLLFDLLASLEKETGCIMANSPTQTVGYQVVDGLEKVQHPIRLFVKRNFSRDGKNQAGKAPWTVKSRFRGRVV